MISARDTGFGLLVSRMTRESILVFQATMSLRFVIAAIGNKSRAIVSKYIYNIILVQMYTGLRIKQDLERDWSRGAFTGIVGRGNGVAEVSRRE